MRIDLEASSAEDCSDSIWLDAHTVVYRMAVGEERCRAPRSAADDMALAALALQRRFEVLAQINPGAVAVQCDACRLTYGELDDQADGLAVLLQQQGIGAGSVVAIRMAPSLAMARAVLAVLKAGGACLVLDPAQTVAQLSAALAAWSAAVLLTAADAAPLPAMATLQLRCSEDGAGLPFAWPHEYPLDGLSPAYACHDAQDGVSLRFGSHRSVLCQLQAIQELSPIRQGDCVLQSAAASQDAFPLDALWALSHGARLLIAAPGETEDPNCLRQLIRREHIAAMHAVPALRALLEREPDHADLDSLRTLFCAIPLHD